jgi:hypothetical protein
MKKVLTASIGGIDEQSESRRAVVHILPRRSDLRHYICIYAELQHHETQYNPFSLWKLRNILQVPVKP